MILSQGVGWFAHLSAFCILRNYVLSSLLDGQVDMLDRPSSISARPFLLA